MDSLLDVVNQIKSSMDSQFTPKGEMEARLQAIEVRFQAIEQQIKRLEAAPAKWGSMIVSIISAAAAILAVMQ